jgi:acetyl esterase/lipase
VLWFHGGGWQSGDKGADLNGIRDLAPALVEHGYVAISCNYRLAPAHRHPAQVNDAARAVRWVRAHAATYGVDPNRVGVVGISAGGHLACMLAVHAPKTGEEALDRFPGTVEAAVSLNGVSELRPGGPTNKLLQSIYPAVVGDDPKALADMSPITFVTRRAAPLLLVIGDKDNMVPIAQSQIMADALKKAGAEHEFLSIPGAGHGIFPSSTPEARDAAVDFFNRHLKPSKKAP